MLGRWLRPSAKSVSTWHPSKIKYFTINLFESTLTIIHYFIFFYPYSPVTDAWRGGCSLTKDPQFSSQLVTRREYEEHGFSLCLQRFDV